MPVEQIGGVGNLVVEAFRETFLFVKDTPIDLLISSLKTRIHNLMNNNSTLLLMHLLPCLHLLYVVLAIFFTSR